MIIKLLYEFGLLQPLSGIPIAIVFLVTSITIIIVGCDWIGGKFPVVMDFQITDNTEKKFYKSFFFKYPVWGFIQQLVIVIPIYVILTKLFPNNSYNSVLTAVIFGMIHFPNFILMFATMFMTMMFLIHFNIHHNVYILGIIHGMVATVLEFYLPLKLKTHFLVWRGYAKSQQNI